MQRVLIKPKSVIRPKEGGAYFAPPSSLSFFSTGCALLDLALGRGWPVGRIINIVGDKSTGKTLLAIEAIANFILEYPKGEICYADAESAFDPVYARRLGFDPDRVTLNDHCQTVEEFFKHFSKWLGKVKSKGLYILDSLDSLSDDAEMDREAGDKSYGMAKAKMMSEFFRKYRQQIKEKDVTLIVISQIRDAVGVVYGKKTKRAGGRALDFYASSVVYLTHTKRLKRTHKGVERVVGVEINALIEKNKVGNPFRECTFPIMFGYGIDDVKAGLDWLVEVRKITTAKRDEYLKRHAGLQGDDLIYFRTWLKDKIEKRWGEVEASFAPERSKYGTD